MSEKFLLKIDQCIDRTHLMRTRIDGWIIEMRCLEPSDNDQWTAYDDVTASFYCVLVGAIRLITI